VSDKPRILDISPLLRGDPDAQATPLVDRVQAAVDAPDWIPTAPPLAQELLCACAAPTPSVSTVREILRRNDRLDTASSQNKTALSLTVDDIVAAGLRPILSTASRRDELVVHSHLVASLGRRLAATMGLSPTLAAVSGRLLTVGRAGVTLASQGSPLVPSAMVDRLFPAAGRRISLAWALPAPLVCIFARGSEATPLGGLVALADEIVTQACASGPGQRQAIAWDVPDRLTARARGLGLDESTLQATCDAARALHAAGSHAR
jgi:hypothetical protein